MSEKHLRAWFAVFVVAVFFGGLGVGVIAERFLSPPDKPAPPPLGTYVTAPPPFPGQMPAMAMRRLMERLDLTADQQKKIDDIFAARRDRLQKIRSEVTAKFESEQTDFRNEIKKVLTPDQQKRFDQWLADEPMPGIRRGPGRGFGRGMGMGPGMPGRAPRERGPER